MIASLNKPFKSSYLSLHKIVKFNSRVTFDFCKIFSENVHKKENTEYMTFLLFDKYLNSLVKYIFLLYNSKSPENVFIFKLKIKNHLLG